MCFLPEDSEWGRPNQRQAGAGAEQPRQVATVALAVPLNKPLDTFDACSWTISSVDWWFGDGTPNLLRDRRMLFEQVACMLLDKEELEYYLAVDAERYRARPPSRLV